MSEDMTLLDSTDKSEETALVLAFKNYNGETESGQPNYEKAAEYFEKARREDVTKEAEFLLSMARAYRECGKSIHAIHWFKRAISDYGMNEAEPELMKLYQTGVVGKELKEKADKYIATVEKADKEQRINNLLEEYEKNKVDYPESFLSDLNYLLAFEKEYVELINSTKPLRVPPLKKGLFGGNKREIEKIQAKNKEYEEVRKSQAELYEDDKKRALEEKEALGIKGKLFFEYPLLTENARNCVRLFRKDLDVLGTSKNYSLYSFGNKQALEFYLYDEGYDVREFHGACTYEAGELFLFMADENGKLITKDNLDGNNIRLYTCPANSYTPRVATFNYVKKLLVDTRFILLHRDWEYFKEHRDEKYTLKYLWDYDYRIVDRYRTSLSVDESLKNYYMGSKDLTDCYADLAENYQNSMRKYFSDNNMKNIAGADDGEPYDERYMKKALLVYAGDRIVAVAIPRKEADVILVHGNLRKINLDINDEEYTRFTEVESITLEKGTKWEYYLATTIHYLAVYQAKQLKPVDGTEIKPEGIPDKLWRLWLRARYANQNA